MHMQVSSLCISVAFLLASRQAASCATCALQLPVIMRCIGGHFYQEGSVHERDVRHITRLCARLLQELLRRRVRPCGLFLSRLRAFAGNPLNHARPYAALAHRRV